MKTRNEEFDLHVANLERIFQKSYTKEEVVRHYKKGAAPKFSRKPRFASYACGLLGTAVAFNAAMTQNFQPFQAPQLIYSVTSETPYVNTHTIAGTAAIHEHMQLGIVNVQKSAITGIVDSKSMTSSLYWTFELKNNNYTDKEASIIVDLPKNSAVSRATLWVNGVPQEAAFSSNSQVKNAYDSIVVRHRDPLLVTQTAPNQIKILAAPVPANGGTMQFRIGITAPAEKGADGRYFVKLPSITKSNLKFDAQQDVHLSSDTPISGLGTTEESGLFFLNAKLPAEEMKKANIAMQPAHIKRFSTRLTHTSPQEYLQAEVAKGKLKLKRVKEKPSGEYIQDDDVAFRLSHIWAHSEIERKAATGDLNGACDIANVYRIVSSVSGATVLEQDYDYSNSGLNRDMYRTLGHSSSTGTNFTQKVGYVAGEKHLEYYAPQLKGATNGTIGARSAAEAPMLQGNATSRFEPDGNEFAPVLQGASIGPQSQDATVIQGINCAGTVRVNNLANLEALLNLWGMVTYAIGLGMALFLACEAFLNGGLRLLRLNKSQTICLAAFIGIFSWLTPTILNTMFAWARDANLFS